MSLKHHMIHQRLINGQLRWSHQRKQEKDDWQYFHAYLFIDLPTILPLYWKLIVPNFHRQPNVSAFIRMIWLVDIKHCNVSIIKPVHLQDKCRLSTEIFFRAQTVDWIDSWTWIAMELPRACKGCTGEIPYRIGIPTGRSGGQQMIDTIYWILLSHSIFVSNKSQKQV